MSACHLKREPQRVGKNKTWWFYEQNGGLSVVVEPDPDGRTRIVKIPWPRLRAALKRKDAPPKRRQP